MSPSSTQCSYTSNNFHLSDVETGDDLPSGVWYLLEWNYSGKNKLTLDSNNPSDPIGPDQVGQIKNYFL